MTMPTADSPTAPPFDWQAVYHVGIRVLQMDAAMASIGTALGLRWGTPIERDQPWWSPASGPAVARLRFTYSTAGPQYVELLQGSAGSVWDARDGRGPGTHHVGLWVDDVAATTEHLVAGGWVLEAANAAPDDGYGMFSYVRSPDGVLVEPVSTELRPGLERWLAAG